MNINGNKIKETLTKGFVLMALTGTLVSKNPIKFNNDVNIVYAATNIEQTKKDALKVLKGIYKTYNKKYYTSKNYDKLTKYYNKGVSVIKNAKSENSIDSAIEKYGNLIKNIKPTILVKYQNKLEKKLLKTYKKLITKNTYSESNLEKIESLKEEGVEKIHSSLTKTQSKKAKNNYITKLNDVKTLVQQVRKDAINFINDNRDISREAKEVLIEQIGNMNEVENITSILEEYGYTYEEEEEYVETNPNKMTVELLNNDEKLKEFANKWYDNHNDALGRCYYSKDNEFVFASAETTILMAYMINYQYIDSDKSFNYFDDFMEYEYEKDAIIYLEMYYGGTARALDRGYIMDLDSLIIENNEIKGLGKLLNDLQKAILKDDTDKEKELYEEYLTKYTCKNCIIDSVVCMLARYYNIETDMYDKANSMSSNRSKSTDVANEYFLDQYNEKYNKVK